MRIPKTKRDLDEMGFKIIPKDKIDLSTENRYAVNSWRKLGVTKAYQKNMHKKMLREIIDKYKPSSVLEFGCNVGTNLREIRKYGSGIRCVGIDVNEKAIKFGKRKYGLDLRVGGEERLSDFEDKEFDLVFTLSVLDHIPDITTSCNALVRCSKNWVICIEISLPIEGKIVSVLDQRKNKVKKAADATYSWHVDKYFTSKRVKNIDIENTYIDVKSGPYYKYYTVELIR